MPGKAVEFVFDPLQLRGQSRHLAAAAAALPAGIVACIVTGIVASIVTISGPLAEEKVEADMMAAGQAQAPDHVAVDVAGGVADVDRQRPLLRGIVDVGDHVLDRVVGVARPPPTFEMGDISLPGPGQPAGRRDRVIAVLVLDEDTGYGVALGSDFVDQRRPDQFVLRPRHGRMREMDARHHAAGLRKTPAIFITWVRHLVAPLV